MYHVTVSFFVISSDCFLEKLYEQTVKWECRPQKQVINPNECLGMARSIKDAQNLQGFHVFSWLLPISSLCARLRKGRYRNIKTACTQPPMPATSSLLTWKVHAGTAHATLASVSRLRVRRVVSDVHCGLNELCKKRGTKKAVIDERTLQRHLGIVPLRKALAAPLRYIQPPHPLIVMEN